MFTQLSLVKGLAVSLTSLGLSNIPKRRLSRCRNLPDLDTDNWRVTDCLECEGVISLLSSELKAGQSSQLIDLKVLLISNSVIIFWFNLDYFEFKWTLQLVNHLFNMDIFSIINSIDWYKLLSLLMSRKKKRKKRQIIITSVSFK